MGQTWSASWTERKDVERVVLVPPRHERYERGASRFCKSAYPHLFGKAFRKWLFEEYVHVNDVQVRLRLEPPDERRVQVRADVGREAKVRLRWQPDHENKHTFAEMGAGGTGKTSLAEARGSLFDPTSGLGVFGRMPLSQIKETTVGLRYGSEWASVGLTAPPFSDRWNVNGWSCFRWGKWLAGMELDGLEQLSKCTLKSAGLGYTVQQQQGGGGGTFQASVEVREHRHLVVSVFQHLAIQRRVKNPLEEEGVVGITNYVDLGVEVSTPLVTGAVNEARNAEEPAMVNLGCSWQLNKNILLKARLSSKDVAAAAAFKSWWEPNVCMAVCSRFDFHDKRAKHGVEIRVENSGTVKYERAHPSFSGGPARTQKHKADTREVDVASGHRPFIPGKTWNIVSDDGKKFI